MLGPLLHGDGATEIGDGGGLDGGGWERGVGAAGRGLERRGAGAAAPWMGEGLGRRLNREGGGCGLRLDGEEDGDEGRGSELCLIGFATELVLHCGLNIWIATKFLWIC